MSETNRETPAEPGKFDPAAFPPDTLFHDRREGRDRRNLRPAAPPAPPAVPAERRAKKERRRRIDPTTFEKQYTPEELEFMTAMQRFKVQSGKSFPSHRDVLRVAVTLGYRRPVRLDPNDDLAAVGAVHGLGDLSPTH